MFLITNLKRFAMVCIYLLTIFNTSVNLEIIVNNTTNNTLFDNVLLVILGLITLGMMWYNYKVDKSDVVVLLATIIVTCILSLFIVGFVNYVFIFNFLIAIMFSKYINVENKNDHQFTWLNAWTYLGMTIFFVFVFIGIFNFWLSMVFSLVLLNTLLKQTKSIQADSTKIKEYVRKEIVLFFLIINILFLIQS